MEYNDAYAILSFLGTAFCLGILGFSSNLINDDPYTNTIAIVVSYYITLAIITIIVLKYAPLLPSKISNK